jgi:hypothetical protein
MPTTFTVQQDDITRVPSDLLLLKHAKGFHGADLIVANALTGAGICTEHEISPHPDGFATVDPKKVIAPAQVMFVGTPPLRDFSYSQMRHFARRSIEILAEEGKSLDVVTTTIHGVNYGLDASEALQNLVLGFREGLSLYSDCRISRIAFVEKKERTARIIKAALDGLGLSVQTEPRGRERARGGAESERCSEPTQVRERPTGHGQAIERTGNGEPKKKHVFVAMPFAEEFQDIYEFGIYGPVRKCGFICERVDEPLFTGDILQRITNRISTAEFIVADLTGARANVYLEVGYAWGRNVPVIALAREGEKLHFDVSTHRCIFYRTIGQLAKELEKLIRGVYEGRRERP